MSPISASPSSPAKRQPIHPPLTDIPIGAIAVVAVCDLISAVGGDDRDVSRELFRAGTFTLMVGTAVLFLAVVAGFVDRTRVSQAGTSARRAIDVHAWTMVAVGVLSVVDIAVRRTEYAAARHTPGAVLALTLAILAMTIVGGALGGKLVYRRGLGVAPVAPRPGGVQAPPAPGRNVARYRAQEGQQSSAR